MFHVRQYIDLFFYIVGTSHKSAGGPQQHLHWSDGGPFRGSAEHQDERLYDPFQGPHQIAA